MNYFIIFLVLVVAVAGIPTEKSASEIVESLLVRGPHHNKKAGRAFSDPVETDWISQKLDNFDSSNTEQWWMRYLRNLNNFQPQSPIFIYVGGEWDVSSDAITSGHFYDIGKELNAAFYYTEHRYYGESKPTQDLSNDNMKYVSVKQALADLANFIRTMKSNPDMANSKVILASGSYGGNMVTWFRKLYPDLAVGAWASSAPLRAKVDFVEYNEVAGEALRAVCGQDIYDRVANGIRDLESLFDTDVNGFLKKMKICSNFDVNNEYDMWHAFKTLSNLFSNIIQGRTYHGIIYEVCDVFKNFEGSDVDAIANFFNSILNTRTCVSMKYEDRVRYLEPTNWDFYSGSFNGRAWQYQLCTEYGYFQTSSQNQPFGSRYPVQYFLQQCDDLFGIKGDEVYANVERTNREFGGVNPGVTNVFWSHGGLDPWKSMGIHQNNGKNNVMKWYTHFYDTTSIDNNLDTPEMIELKNDVRTAIRRWLGVNN